MLMWVDEIAWIAASLDYPNYNFVTIAMDRVEFRRSVGEGVILAFQTTRRRVGKTSVSYEVDVFKRRCIDQESDPGSIFNTTVTLVRVDEAGQKALIEPSVHQ